MKKLNRILILAGLGLIAVTVFMAFGIPKLADMQAKYDRILILSMCLAAPGAFLVDAGRRLSSEEPDRHWVKFVVSVVIAEAALFLCYKGFGFTPEGTFEAPFINWAVSKIDILAEKLAK